jgi:hypothetical protein
VIVEVASLQARRATPGSAAYAAKAGLVAFPQRGG